MDLYTTDTLHRPLRFKYISLAVAQVAAVQREFVEKLLTKPVFQRHMTAVREVLNMLRAAQKIRKDGESWNGKALEVVISFVHRRWSDNTDS